MSVSDVIEVADGEYKGFWYCDSIGFQKIDFNKDLTHKHEKKKIRVLMVNPGELAEIQYISPELNTMQKAVGGYIECFYPFEEDVCIICNDSGKLDGMTPNRAVYDSDGEILDVIFGPFFICDASKEEFTSLSTEQASKYMDKFRLPEKFYKSNDKIVAVTYTPKEQSRDIQENER